MTDGLYDYWSDQLIGPATEDQVALSDSSFRRGGGGLIAVDAAGRVCAFADYVKQWPPDVRAVFTQPGRPV